MTIAIFVGADELLISNRWACSSWEKCKRLLQPHLFRCSDAAGPLSGTPASSSLAHGLSYANLPVATPSSGVPLLEQKLLCDVARPTTQRYIRATTWGWHDPQPWSAACLWDGHSTSNHALPSWRISHMRIQNPTGCDGKVATFWNYPNTGFQTWEFLEGSCNLSAAQLSWAHPCHWSCMQGGQDGRSKAANLSFTLIISCASSDQWNVPLISRKTWGEDLAGVGGRSWMRLGASRLLLPRRQLRSDGYWSLGQKQQAPSAASWVTEKPYLGSTLLTSTSGGA